MPAVAGLRSAVPSSIANSPVDFFHHIGHCATEIDSAPADAEDKGRRKVMIVEQNGYHAPSAPTQLSHAQWLPPEPATNRCNLLEISWAYPDGGRQDNRTGRAWRVQRMEPPFP